MTLMLELADRELKMVINMFQALEKSINIMRENKESQQRIENYKKIIK